nr:MAG TPA: Portal [Caudoviricetes sp.]
MQMTAVYSCVRILSEAVAGLPLHLYKYTDTGSAKATNHPLYALLHDGPNPEMTSFMFLETLMTHLLLWGNAYAQIIRNGKGEVVVIYPLMPDRMTVDRDENGMLYYEYQTNSGDAPVNKQSTVRLAPTDVLHIAGLGFDGLGAAGEFLGNAKAVSLLAIEKIKSGDKVISTDPETMETSPKTVLETYIREVTTLVHLTVNGEEIVTTVDHPFYVKNQGFIKAGELIVGDELLDVNGNVLLVEKFNVELTDEPVTVYNFQVEGFHTYHVGCFYVLVHNADYNQSPKEIMAERTKGLDTREHPSKYKQISAKEKSRLESKVRDRTITKDEYKKLEWNKKISARRQDAVNEFWDQEQIRLQKGENGTRNWSPQQKADILNGKRPTYNGKTIQGHHTYSVSKYPHLSGNSEVIYPATFNEHLKGWHGGNFRNSLPGEPIKTIIDF